MAEMRALTVQQPWAAFIAHLDKRIENRTWRFPDRHQGTRIAIHAGAQIDAGPNPAPPGSPDEWASLFANRAEWDAWRFWSLGAKPRDVEHWPPKLALSAIVAVATLADCHRCTADELCGYSGDWSESSRHPGLCSLWCAPSADWHWELSDVHSLPEPVPCRGMLGLWRLPPDVEAQVRGQLGADDA